MWQKLILQQELKSIAANQTLTTLQKVKNGLAAIFTAIMNANPIGLIVLAAGALVGLFVLLYQKCEPIREFMDYIWEKIK